jgi:hypothetical protein
MKYFFEPIRIIMQKPKHNPARYRYFESQHTSEDIVTGYVLEGQISIPGSDKGQLYLLMMANTCLVYAASDSSEAHCV